MMVYNVAIEVVGCLQNFLADTANGVYHAACIGCNNVINRLDMALLDCLGFSLVRCRDPNSLYDCRN